MIKNILIYTVFLTQISLAAPSDDFVIRVKTDNPGYTTAEMFRIPTKNALTYNYNVDCNDDGIDEETGQTGDYYCDYSFTGLNLGAGTYTIRIKDNVGDGTGFPSINFNNTFDSLKIIEVVQWGTGKWTNMQRSFYGAENMIVSATDTPDFSQVTTMESMFRRAFVANPDTSNWDTSSVTNMKSLFNEAQVATPDTSNWDTHLVTDMSFMFRHAFLARPIVGSWDISNVTDMTAMFSAVSLPFNTYDRILIEFAAKTVQMNVPFSAGTSYYCSQNAQNARLLLQNTHNWSITDGNLCASPAITKDFVFKVDTTIPVIAGGTSNTEYKIRINPSYTYNYNVDCNNDGSDEGTALSSDFICDYSALGGAGIYTIRIKDNNGDNRGFSGFGLVGASTDYDQKKIVELIQWGTFKWQTLEQAFLRASNMFVTALDIPDFSEVISTNSMFTGAFFANPTTKFWDTSNIEDMNSMFKSALSAKPDTSLWDTAFVTSMASMFRGAVSANPDTSSWNTSSVQNMTAMFRGATNANPDTSSWDTSSVQTMESMFRGATSANPDTRNWDVSEVTTMLFMFKDVTLPTVNYDAILVAFESQIVKNGVDFDGGNSHYCSKAAQLAHDKLQSNFAWTITDLGLCAASDPANDFVITVKTDNTGSSADDQFMIFVNNSVTNHYNVDCNNDGVNEILGATTTHNCDYSPFNLNTGPGVYTIRIKDVIGDGTGLAGFNFSPDGDKILSVEQWGTAKWQSTSFMFSDTSNLVINAIDIPDFSQVINMSDMFLRSPLVNPDTRRWDVSQVISMKDMFALAINARPNIDSWNMSKVLSMEEMFGLVSLESSYYDHLLIQLEAKNVQPNVLFGGSISTYTYCSQAAQLARMSLINDDLWTIGDGGLDPSCQPLPDLLFANGFE